MMLSIFFLVFRIFFQILSSFESRNSDSKKPISSLGFSISKKIKRNKQCYLQNNKELELEIKLVGVILA